MDGRASDLCLAALAIHSHFWLRGSRGDQNNSGLAGKECQHRVKVYEFTAQLAKGLQPTVSNKCIYDRFDLSARRQNIKTQI